MTADNVSTAATNAHAHAHARPLCSVSCPTHPSHSHRPVRDSWLRLCPHPVYRSDLQVQETLEKYQELKQGKKLAYIIYGISDDKKSIVVLKTSESRDFEEFVADLPEKECRWAVYDFEFELPGEGKRNKLVFVQW